MQLAFPRLFSLPVENTPFIASSPLLVNAATQQFVRECLQAGQNTWQRPLIVTAEGWLTSLWQQARFGGPTVPALLSPQQEQSLWREEIEADTLDLFDANATARLARQANSVLAQWQIPVDHEAWREHVDGEQFLRWRGRVRARCQREGWMVRADLWHAALGWELPGQAVFFGFTAPSPAMAALQKRIANCRVFGTAEVESAGRAPLFAADNLEQELEHAARWSRAHWEQNPQHQLALCVPDLAAHRSLVERVLERVFYPRSSARLTVRPPRESIFHLFASAPLPSHPLISAALSLLDLGNARIELACATTLLRSPFLTGAQDERDGRAAADLKLRRLREPDVSLRDIQYVLQDCPVLSAQMGRVQQLRERQPATAELAYWSRFFADLCQAGGWPGNTSFTAEGEDVIAKWDEALANLGSLGLVKRQLPYAEAMQDLKQLLSGMPGSERGDAFSPVQAVDAAEAEGLRADAAYVVGLAEDSWPPARKLSPLIPMRLQRSHGVPGSSPQSLHAEWIHHTRALFLLAPETHASYSGHLAPSVRPYAAFDNDASPAWTGKLPMDSFERGPLEWLQDTHAPPYAVIGEAPGGTGLLKAQSACPFKAFAEYRMSARTPEEACFGFDARDRGSFLHNALEQVWSELKDSARLRLMPEQDLRGCIERAVNAAVNRQENGAFFEQTERTERERLCDLIYEWLTEVERARTIDFSVETLEREVQYNLAGLPLRMRIDRIDRLKNGQVLLIDYKSGKTTTSMLDCPRPSEPQLLVYAATQEGNVDGVLFGQLKSGELRLVGKTRDRHGFKASKVLGQDWQSTMEEARASVHTLAADFLAGKAAVAPRGDPCKWCGIKPLCRINERPAADAGEDCE